MGLDMYLTKKTYVKNWDHNKKDEVNEWDVSVKHYGKNHNEIKPERVLYIEEEVMYWRKANAIHNWFVENVQDGNDNCQSYYVSREHIQELVSLCEELIEKKGTGIEHEILPTTDGLFFGSQEYDEWYYNDILETYKELSCLLKESNRGEFYYQSSW
jgi:hypothetical protein